LLALVEASCRRAISIIPRCGEPLDQRTLHDALKQNALTQKRPAPERPVAAKGQDPPEKPAESCESKIDHAAALDSDGKHRNNL
jgi:hypothetical protein